jgi:3-deoxy-manno-octulosonate cytidylyltransferase (CMP-KDO synthetase)
MYDKTLIVIPSRIGSTRLARKPLEKIGTITMIEHVISRVKESNIPNICVATDNDDIFNLAISSGVMAVMTNENCPTGTDRVYDALANIEDSEKYDYVVNVQGDMPFVDPKSIIDLLEVLWKTDSDIVTPVVKVSREKVEDDASVCVVATKDNKALYFTRGVVPYYATEFLYHVGIYGFKRDSLTKFVNLPTSFLEQNEKLEQLRALENGMSIELSPASGIPISIDTKKDLEIALEYYNKNLV